MEGSTFQLLEKVISIVDKQQDLLRNNPTPAPIPVKAPKDESGKLVSFLNRFLLLYFFFKNGTVKWEGEEEEGGEESSCRR